MSNEFYVAASGMIARERAVEVHSHNVANITTPGYKADINVYSNFNKHLEKNMTNASAMNDVVQYGGAFVDFSQGNLKTTNKTFDFAIEGKGLFKLSNGNQQFYTRAGNFKLDSEGYLVSNNGFKVMGEGGEINIPIGDVLVNNKGEIYSNGKYIDKLAVFSFNDNQSLQKVGENNFVNTDTTNNIENLSEDATIIQGALEQPNYNIVKGMTDLIGNLRMYETCQKSVKLIDELNEKVINQVGV